MHQATFPKILPAAASLILAFFLQGCIAPVKSYSPPRSAITLGKLPKERFWWGTSTAPFQNEDKGYPVGSKWYFRTDWDLFAEHGGAPKRGDQAVLSWSHFDKDLAALKKLGVSHFRFGVEWARIEPRKGEINEEALQQYAKMAQHVRQAGMEPLLTLWPVSYTHLTLPTNREV